MKLRKLLGMPKIMPRMRMMPKWSDVTGIERKHVGLPKMKVYRPRRRSVRKMLRDV